MIQFVYRLAKRFAVLLPGIAIAYVSIRDIYPYFDRRLPFAVAVFATYVLGAYVLVPALIRLFRIVHPPKHLPLYCITPDGFASDPLNIGIISTRRELITAMETAGWHVADPHTPRNLARVIMHLSVGREYRNAPVSNLYLFGRKQDIAFEIPVKGAVGGRHHVRFWATTYRDDAKMSIHSIDWHHRKQHVYGDNLLWVGASSLDIGVQLIRHNLQLTHMVHPDTDQERQLIVDLLRKKDLVKGVKTIKLDDAYRLTNRVWRGYLHADGKMAIVSLRSTHKN